ncbi:hypothetical protein [Corynebacterium sp. A21]|uniref:hypothetical protein n=1 Tax=Corynebacterium sp. A21 TaxID=3457318 RepID=UPI003FD2785A
MTSVKPSWQLAWFQVRSVERLWAILLLLFVMVPWFALIAGTNGDFMKLASFFVLFILLVSQLARDRRIYRTLGFTRGVAIRQQLVISVPVLVVAGAVTLPGLSGGGWIWALVVALAALGTDIAITLSSIKVERRSAGAAGVVGPAKTGGMIRRLLLVPMLRWTVPLGLVLGLVLGFAEPYRGTLLWTLLLAVGLFGLFYVPVMEIQAGTASLATWQSLGLPRRSWSRAVTPIAVLAPILGLLIALAVLAVLALWNAVDWDVLHRAVAAAPGLAALLAGLSLWVVSAGGTGNALGAGLIGGSGPMIILPSANLLENPTQSGLILTAVVGAIFCLIGLYIQHRLVHAASGARITPDTRAFADR